VIAIRGDFSESFQKLFKQLDLLLVPLGRCLFIDCGGRMEIFQKIFYQMGIPLRPNKSIPEDILLDGYSVEATVLLVGNILIPTLFEGPCLTQS
jgi:hypothetical protein